MRRIRKWIIGLAVGTFLVIAYPIVFAWSPLYCWTDEIGLDTARTRSTTYFFWVRVSTHEKPTTLSETLQTPQTQMETRWCVVNTFSPGFSYSPHHNFHGALSQISELETIWMRLHFSPEAKRLTAQDLLDRWRSDGDYFAADHHLLGPLNDYYSHHHSRGSTISDEEVKQIVSAGANPLP